jgi:hypothetical protein
MAKGFYAHRLPATCIDGALSGSYFNEATAHIVLGDQPTIGQAPHTMFNSACYDSLSDIKTPIPIAQLPTTLAGPTMYDYGKTWKIVVLPSQMYFDAKELREQVGPYDYLYENNNYYKITYEGWRLKNSMVTLPLARKFSNRQPTFTNFTDVYWTDMHPYPNVQQPELELDWLGNLHNDGEAASYPMMYCQGVRQPFLGETYYEDTLSSIDKSKENYLYNFMPFCKPINIYDVDSNKIGYADGLAFQLFIFNGALKNRLNPVQKPKILPTDPAVLIPASSQYWSVELWTYLSVVKTKKDSPVILKSPRLHTHRWWYYTQFYGNTFPAPGTPYIFWRGKFDNFLSGPTIHRINFNLLYNENNKGIDAKSSVTYNTPWTKCNLYLTA